jgi:hypothetical protein
MSTYLLRLFEDRDKPKRRRYTVFRDQLITL